MEPVYIVILLALIEYMVLGGLVGRARGMHGVRAPATTGHEAFERTFRTHQNTLENLIIFIPAVWIFGMYVSPIWGAIIGLAYIAGRALYAQGYMADAAKRGRGMMVGMLANTVLVIGGLIGLVIALI